mmetsp:Transcript_16491/g.35827  ORF Transcript_16491/g.35827 Transcript_16491/m.35827 type:complete len:205 (-) Transcript_16491:371-985(-)|eukprot:CAMPEP_0185845352 /NCGR_PEP_ID=MMETSP1354-20130828/1353_1 /TAXON_ID=708628 /ORGANISM="Erythrolobus madagascarensis, Strain CCMP3276" /LENGTH=204 /DNA_ID=CAMNT_0028545299 /DNA_START=1 /DNA_END=615 /DNA_ORIENTATION=-
MSGEGGSNQGGTASEGPHPLQFEWVLWYDGPAQGNAQKTTKNYGNTLRELGRFSTVEDFWALFNNLVEPSKLAPQTSYQLFKGGIEPKWEDPRNELGGKWTIPLPREPPQMLDDQWLRSALMLIGDILPEKESDDVAGLIVQNRKSREHRLMMWTQTSGDHDLQKSIGEQWKAVSQYGNEILYHAHKDSMASSKSFSSNARLTV